MTTSLTTSVTTSSGSAWFLALRPKTLVAAAAPVFVATALVKASGYPVLWWVSIFALVSAGFIQIGTNLFNDAIDFKKGADTEERIGPKRVTQSGLLSPRQVMIGGSICFLLAAAFGVPLVLQGGWPIVGIGLVSLFLGYAYTGGPFPLAYKGLGDLFVILFFGLVAVMGTFFLHTGHVSVASAVAGLQVGCLATVLIAINNFRDASQDAMVGKKTLAVRFGATFSRVEIAALAFIPFLLGTYWSSVGEKEAAVIPLILIPLARRLVAGIWSHEPSPLYNSFLAKAAALQMLFAVLLSVGLWIVY